MKNRVQLIGNLGNDPEMVKLESGKKLAKFSLATNDKYKNQNGEKIQETQWHNVIAWGSIAEVTEKYLKKGSEIILDGKLTHRNYDDKEGNKKYITEVIANEILILSKKEVA